MSEALLPIPNACDATLAAIERDPLTLPSEALAHLRQCPACAEARVQWLALEEVPNALAPAGYFDHLPTRIQRKLPVRAGLMGRPRRLLWAAAAALLMAGMGVGGFWLGKANKTPLVEATLPRNPSEVQELIVDAPFQEDDDALSQFSTLSQEEAEAVLKQLEAAPLGHP